MLLPVFAMTQVVSVNVSAWTNLDEAINHKIEILDRSIDHTSQSLQIKDVKFISNYQAYIIYEIVDQKKGA